MKYHAFFVIFEKAAKFEIVVSADYLNANCLDLDQDRLSVESDMDTSCLIS